MRSVAVIFIVMTTLAGTAPLRAQRADCGPTRQPKQLPAVSTLIDSAGDCDGVPICGAHASALSGRRERDLARRRRVGQRVGPGVRLETIARELQRFRGGHEPGHAQSNHVDDRTARGHGAHGDAERIARERWDRLNRDGDGDARPHATSLDAARRPEHDGCRYSYHDDRPHGGRFRPTIKRARDDYDLWSGGVWRAPLPGCRVMHT
jgi:hypothetical protein